MSLSFNPEALKERDFSNDGTTYDGQNQQVAVLLSENQEGESQ